MEKIYALIVTYNRKEYLSKLLSALDSQTKQIDSIIIVDNCSNDGTLEYLIDQAVIQNYIVDETVKNTWNNKSIIYYRSSKNTGGSGGFSQGTKIALQYQFDYLWIMDDDVLPTSNCLENLIKEIDEDHQVCIPNRTTESFKDRPVMKFNWNNIRKNCSVKKYNDNYKTNQKLEVCDFPFEGPLLTHKLLSKIGNSDSKFFIFYDDSDYAQKCLKYTKIYFVGEAILHKQILPAAYDGKFTWRNYYFIRNDFYFDKRYNKNKLIPYLRAIMLLLINILGSIKHGNFIRLKYSIKAFNDALFNKMGKTVEPGSF